ncbi:MAG: response regulator transcription factor [Chloroflexota bacterium]|nr:response regulator transcription factor [Chloroflexota bacterium]
MDERETTTTTVQAAEGFERWALVLDDDAPTQEVLRLALQELGLVGRTSGSFVEAREILAAAAAAPTLAILDAVLPGEEVLPSFIADLRQRFTARIPLLLVSALSRARLAAIAKGITDAEIITKPFELDQLIAAIERALASSAGDGGGTASLA